LRTLFGQQMNAVDLLVTPAAPSEAPAGHSDIGSSVFNSLWTLLGAPCISAPIGTGPTGLPIALQMVADIGQDDSLLDRASWITRTLQAQHDLSAL
jgi:Asp-tRNA(Asn)/Glu-tRNA(Gln) amidotransferase A subunit family amidase